MNLLAVAEQAAENIPDNGIAIAITGMSIVFFALLLISGFIAILPKLMEILNEYYPEKVPTPAASSEPAAVSPVPDEVVIAIGAALHQHRST